ncbi:RAD51-associated protein 1 isoform X1 [Pogoniulus pusillus]|uniref:RAD51-associated protein 1 isoform X1 n=1 Tax=Pogoniulus pusillus TaxID=488313 RepID=UPI0030B96CE2
MSRPVRRNKKIVDYSQFGDLEDDDEDFACIAAPSSKKSKSQLKDPKKEKKEKPKKPHKESTWSQKETPIKRLSLDDKLYQRDLEVALALSIKEKSAKNPEVQNSEQGLNQVMDDDIPGFDFRQRTTSKVAAHEKSLTIDSDDREHTTDSDPEAIPSEESEEDSDYSEDDDEDFAVKKQKAKGNKKKTREKMPTEREKKTAKAKINSTASLSPIAEQKSELTQKMSSSSQPIGRPLHTSSPVTDKKPRWIPPAASGSSNNPTKHISVKSPTQCLRLGLSRLARVKPLHPSATSQ